MHVGEIGNVQRLVIEYPRELLYFLVWQLEELIEQAKLFNDLESGRVNGIATEIAKKIAMLFQDDHMNAAPGQ